ncbi:Uncharacterized conserved protein, contains BSD domain [Plasmopara halstedii]|uniref:Uncharacterized conserved protein, contains BSD domain n=1 Tax=Plasmopara halstedii TaxID=4781 RepID=A0A0N7L5F3_PLAHL|nr:Uncharacterized conserved protein, contains BSD domain [Plasmopara halstedii]CEG41315.1 Uncharacterized conserved protein, contains BSD domain [Plasmopara halstedii]|eukprot:XP_024577684.1 Uncharacterized conserved protein, contains BSD domain [Plasmopara halstedii]
MSFSSFYSVVNAIKDKSAEAMSTLSSDLQDFKSIVQEDVAELKKTVRHNMQEGRLSVDRRESDESEEMTENMDDSDQVKQDQDQGQDRRSVESTQTLIEEKGEAEDTLTLLKNSFFSFDVTNSFHSVSSTVQGSLNSMQGSLTSVSDKLQSLNVTSSLGSLEAMGSKLLNSADEYLGTLAGDIPNNEVEELSEIELSAQRFRLLALQEDSETYVDPPLDLETFEKWKLAINPEELVDIQKHLLENYPAVGSKLRELVPSVVDADVFWMHYIYKASLLAAQKQRGADLLQHALNDEEEEIGWDVDSPKAKDDEGKPIFPDDESKVDDEKTLANTATMNGPTSSSDGESWIELDERKDSTSPIAPILLQEPPTSDLTNLKLEEGDEAAEEDSLDWGDDDDISLPETNDNAKSEAKDLETTSTTHEDGSKRGEDWGEWD